MKKSMSNTQQFIEKLKHRAILKDKSLNLNIYEVKKQNTNNIFLQIIDEDTNNYLIICFDVDNFTMELLFEESYIEGDKKDLLLLSMEAENIKEYILKIITE